MMKAKMTEEISMVKAFEVNEERYEDILTKITALCKGFLLVSDKSMEKACSFCRGFLLLLQQLPSSMQETLETNNTL